MHSKSLAQSFLDYFYVRLANTPETRTQVDRIRYRVYCEEFGFENAENFPQHLEADKYDDHSLHCLIVHRRSALPAGCVRLICASQETPLPIEDHCLGSMYLEYVEELRQDPDNACEFSRLAVDTAFRRRRGEWHTQLGEFDALDCTHQEVRSFSLIGVAAFISAVAVSELTNRNKIFGMMDSNLPRRLRSSGLLVQQAGDVMEYHGQRTPYYLTTKRALANMRTDLGYLYDEIYTELRGSIVPQEFVA